MSIDFENLSYTASAVVVWLPKGDEPDPADFAVNDDGKLAPPYPNPEAWWELREAIVKARTLYDTFDKEPWIKTGDIVLSPTDVRRAYEWLKEKK